MEIKTIDDLIRYIDNQLHDWQRCPNGDSWKQNIKDAICSLLFCVGAKAHELKINMEAAQSKDRELLKELSLPDMRDHELIRQRYSSDSAGLDGNYSPKEAHGIGIDYAHFHIALKIREHLKENP